jgi:hypothetical protein
VSGRLFLAHRALRRVTAKLVTPWGASTIEKTADTRRDRRREIISEYATFSSPGMRRLIAIPTT